MNKMLQEVLTVAGGVALAGFLMNVLPTGITRNLRFPG